MPRKIYNILRGTRRDVLIALIIALVFATSSPWWASYIPLHISWKQPAMMQIAFLPGDFEIDLNNFSNPSEPYLLNTYGPGRIPVEIKVEVKGDVVTLLRKAEIIEQHIDDPALFIKPINTSILRVAPANALVGNGRNSSSILIEIDSSYFILRPYYVEYLPKGSRIMFGELKVKLFYEVKGKVSSKEVIIPMYFVKE